MQQMPFKANKDKGLVSHVSASVTRKRNANSNNPSFLQEAELFAAVGMGMSETRLVSVGLSHALQILVEQTLNAPPPEGILITRSFSISFIFGLVKIHIRGWDELKNSFVHKNGIFFQE